MPPSESVEDTVCAMIAHQHRHMEVGAKEAADGAGGLFVENDPLDKPVFVQNTGGLVVVVPVAEFRLSGVFQRRNRKTEST